MEYTNTVILCLIQGLLTTSHSSYLNSGGRGSRWDFNGEVIRVGVLRFSPWIDWDSAKEVPQLNDLKGIEGYMLQELSRRLNFTVSFVLPEDGSWGEMLENGTFTGLRGLVNNGTVDISMCGLGHSWEGVHYGNIDHGVPFMVDCLRYLTRPARPYPGWMRLIQPWNWTVWSTMTAFLFILSLLLGRCLERFGFNRALFLFIQVLTTQTFTTRFKSVNASRILLAFTSCSFMILSASYSSVLVSRFVFPLLTPIPESDRDLVSSGYEVGMMDYGDGMRTSLIQSGDPTLIALSGMTTWIRFDKAWEAFSPLDDIMTESFAFVEWESTFFAFGYNRRENYEMNPYPFYCFPKVWAIGKGLNRLKNSLDWHIMKLMEGGFIQKWWVIAIEKSLHESATTTYPQQNGTHGLVKGPMPLSLDHLQSPLLFFISGCIISSLAFSLELALSRWLHHAFRRTF